MKYLQFERLEMMSNCLTSLNQNNSTQVQGRLEAFSCKDTVEDKKLKRFVEAKFLPQINTLPHNTSQPKHEQLNYEKQNIYKNIELKRLDTERESRKCFFYLLATLNAVFPDYDYSFLNPDAFTPLPSSDAAIKLIDSAILLHRSTSLSTDLISETVWNCIDEVVYINECEIYNFSPDPDDEPDTNGANVL